MTLEWQAKNRLLPLSLAQQRCWFLTQLAGDKAFSEIHTFKLCGSLHSVIFERAINEVICRHEMLRTNFVVVDGQPMQIMHDQRQVTLTTIDLQHLSVVQQEVEIGRLRQKEAEQPFNLVEDMLIRVTLIYLSATEQLLFLTLHQIVSDHASAEIFMQDLALVYAAFVQDAPAPLPVFSQGYADFVEWQQSWLQSDRCQRALAYWRQRLEGLVPLELPTDHLRPVNFTFNTSLFSTPLPDALLDRLRALSQSESVPLFATLLSAFQITLARHSGQDNIAVGSLAMQRPDRKFDRLIGQFENMLVLRTDLSDNPRFLSFLHRVYESVENAAAYQDLPFAHLVNALPAVRDSSRSLLVQALFQFYDAESSVFHVPECVISATSHRKVTEQFDLTLSLQLEDETSNVVVLYNSDLFAAATIERLVGHFETLLQSIVQHPERRLAELTWLTMQEEHYLLHDVNRPFPALRHLALGASRCLHQLVCEQAARTPDAIALEYGPETLTYHVLVQRAHALALRLRTLGVGPEVLVGICLLRSCEMVISLLAVLMAGGAYVPLDPDYPDARLAFILQDTQIQVLICQQETRKHVPAFQGTVLLRETFSETWEEAMERGTIDSLSSAVVPANLAYVIYTSGSTGRPKGVAITHASVTHFVLWAQTAYTPEELRSVLVSTSICFDISILELFVPLSCGGRCILVENALQWEMQQQPGAVTLVSTVPSVARELLKLGGFAETVQTLNLGGEALPLSLVQEIEQRTKIKRIINLYGPTEDTVYSAVACLPHPITQMPPIGRPIEGTRIYLLDKELCLVAAGLPGEIYLGGAGLARGYLHRPELTAERFIPDSYSGQAGARLYKTGDLARYREDGSIEFLGRIDDQVKVRGFRIELGEIETVLNQHPAVSECVVVVREDVPGDKRLVAYVVTAPQARLTSSELRALAQEYLQAYMVPAHYVFLDALPLTINRKVDRRQLPPPDLERAEPDAQFIAPRTATEQKLAVIWSEILQVERIGVNEDFFVLGGHSLLATQVVSRIRDSFALDFSLRNIFSHATIEQMGAEIDQAQLHMRPVTSFIARTARQRVRIQVSTQGEVSVSDENANQ